MLFRIIALGAVVFCGAMTALLIRMVYYPEFDRLPKVDPEHVLRLFLDNHEPDDIFIYNKAGELVGDVSLTPRSVDNAEDVQIAFVARGMVEMPGVALQKLNWRGKVLLGAAPERKVKALDFSVRFSNPPVTVALHVAPAEMSFHYTVSQGGEIVTDSRTDPDAIGVTQIQLLLAAWGVDPGASVEAMEKRVEEGGGWQARQGVIKIAGHRASAYFVVMEVPGAGELRLTVSEAGELLEIATPLGYDMLSAAMREPPNPLPYNK